MTIIVKDDQSPDMVVVDGLGIMITRSEAGAVFSTDVPHDDGDHATNVKNAITRVLECVALLAPDAPVSQISACNNHPSAVRTTYVKHWFEEDEQSVVEVLAALTAKGKELGETEIMKRLDYTRERARKILSGNPTMNISTMMKLARACGYRLVLQLEEDPNWLPPTPGE